MRKQREVQVPSQVAHSTPTPVLKYVQVHLSLELGARGDFSCYTACFTPFPAQPSPAQLNPIELTSSRHGGVWWVRFSGGGFLAPPRSSMFGTRPSGCRKG